MNRKPPVPALINSISELHSALRLPKPKHPLVSVINFEQIEGYANTNLSRAAYNFYCIAMKKNLRGTMGYGQTYYDFEEGVMAFFSLGQVVTTNIADELGLTCWCLLIHPDFLQTYSLARQIRTYGYFAYSANEALYLSEDEEAMIASIMRSIEKEYSTSIDRYSQDIMVSQIDLLLNYCNRFYNRQFITRKTANHDLLSRLDALLTAHFAETALAEIGLPTVHAVAEQLQVSPKYLSDMLRAFTGQNAQQHIHDKLIEKAKELLTTSSLSVSEIAFQLGFEHPQSFHKLFKNKTNCSPLDFKASFN